VGEVGSLEGMPLPENGHFVISTVNFAKFCMAVFDIYCTSIICKSAMHNDFDCVKVCIHDTLAFGSP